MDYVSFKYRNRVLDLYEAAKRGIWNPATDLDWEGAVAPVDPFKKAKADLLSSLYYGEVKGIELAARSLVLAEKEEEKIYFSIQVLEESRHLEVLGRYLDALDQGYEVNPRTIQAFDAILACESYGEVLAGNSIGTECWAGEIYREIQDQLKPLDPFMSRMAHKIIGDESRHIEFGRIYFERRGEVSDEEKRINQKISDLMIASLDEFANRMGVFDVAVKPIFNRMMHNVETFRKQMGFLPKVAQI